MNGKKIGYIRVSSVDQNESRQLEGIELDKVFQDKVSGKDLERPELKRMLEYVREGDHLYVHSMDRFARKLADLKSLVDKLLQKNVKVKFVKEGLSFEPSENENPMNQLMLHVMGAFAEFERTLLRERQREGIALAKKRGVYLGRKPKFGEEEVARVKRRIEAGEHISGLAREMKVSRVTIYRALREAQGEPLAEKEGENSFLKKELSSSSNRL